MPLQTIASKLSPMACAIDHLVVAAPTLEVGAQYIEELLAVEFDPGGQHERMGTPGCDSRQFRASGR
jgi:hypothetical protein